MVDDRSLSDPRSARPTRILVFGGPVLDAGVMPVPPTLPGNVISSDVPNVNATTASSGAAATAAAQAPGAVVSITSSASYWLNQVTGFAGAHGALLIVAAGLLFHFSKKHRAAAIAVGAAGLYYGFIAPQQGN